MDGIIRALILPYLEDQSSEIRCEAAVACARFIAMSESSVSAILRSEVLDKLLLLAVADPNPDIRLTVLHALQHPNLDEKLAEGPTLYVSFYLISLQSRTLARSLSL